MAALAAVLVGTMAPIALDALNLGKISVGPPHFDAVFVPVVLPLALLMGIGPLVSWRSGNGRPLFKKLRIVFLIRLIMPAPGQGVIGE